MDKEFYHHQMETLIKTANGFNLEKDHTEGLIMNQDPRSEELKKDYEELEIVLGKVLERIKEITKNYGQNRKSD